MKGNSELRSLASSWEKDLNKIILNWDLIPGSPRDEFGLLTHKLISHLTKGAQKKKIHDILESELISRYGLSPTEIELEQFAFEITDWWIHNK